MAKSNNTITSLSQLQKMIPRLLQEYGKDQSLMRAAAANPILALEHIGLSLSETVKKQIIERVLSDPESQTKLDAIQQKANKIAGKKINFESNTSVSNFLKKELGAEVKLAKKMVYTAELLDIVKKDITTVSAFVKSSKEVDPLTRFKKSHPLIPLLLKYRAIKASTPKLASKNIFNSLLKSKKGDEGQGIRFSKLTFRLQDRERRKKAS